MNVVTLSVDELIRFRNRLYPPAQKVEETTGIKRDLCITQAAHESEWGISNLARRHNNLFGMTAPDSWVAAGKPVTMLPSREFSKYPPEKIKYWKRPGDVLEKMKDGKGGSVLKVLIDFCEYGSWEESMNHWAEHIVNFPLYRTTYAAALKGDAPSFAKAIADAGYASDPHYEAELLRVYQTVISLPPITVA